MVSLLAEWHHVPCTPPGWQIFCGENALVLPQPRAKLTGTLPCPCPRTRPLLCMQSSPFCQAGTSPGTFSCQAPDVLHLSSLGLSCASDPGHFPGEELVVCSCLWSLGELWGPPGATSGWQSPRGANCGPSAPPGAQTQHPFAPDLCSPSGTVQVQPFRMQWQHQRGTAQGI